MPKLLNWLHKQKYPNYNIIWNKNRSRVTRRVQLFVIFPPQLFHVEPYYRLPDDRKSVVIESVYFPIKRSTSELQTAEFNQIE